MKEHVTWALSLGLMIAALWLVFMYVPPEEEMGDIQRIFYFHVASAWVAFLGFFVVFVASILYLWKRDSRWDILAHSSAEIGVLFITLVLITGPIWARPVWGTWWTWEPRLTTSLVLWLLYVAYLLVRSYAGEQSRGARFAAVLGIVAFVDVPIVYFSVDLSRLVHPPKLVTSLEASMLITLAVSVAAFTALYVLLLSRSIMTKRLSARVKRLRYLLEEQEG